jgi:4-amino-4-deoxy-L-arabinose transferase-like glycosyltransferase
MPVRWTKSTWLMLTVVFVVALGVRLAYVATGQNNPQATDALDADIAHNILDHGRWFYFSEPAALYLSKSTSNSVDTNSARFAALDKAPQYPAVSEPVGTAAVLTAVWAVVGGRRYLPMQILQAVVDALAALLVYRIALLLFRRRPAALVASMLYAVYLPIAWETIVVYNDIWAVDLTIVIVATYLEALNAATHRRSWLVACGLLAGFGAYFRPNVLFIPIAIALATMPQLGWRVALRRGLSVFAIAALLLVPWTIRNYEDFHAFIPTRSAFWENMWYGLGEQPNDFGATENVGGTVRAEVARERPDLRFESPAWDAFLKARVVKALEDHPAYYLELVVRRVGQATVFIYGPEWMGRVASPIGYPGGPLVYVVDHPLGVLGFGLEPAAFLLAMLAMLCTWRRARREHAILIAVVLSVLVPYVAIHVDERYILPATFAYCVWIGLGADLLVERVRRWRSRAAEAAVQRQAIQQAGSR